MVEAAYLVEIDSADPPNRGLLIAVAVQVVFAERVARAAITKLQAYADALRFVVDLTAFDPYDVPAWLTATEVAPFYNRAMAEQGSAAPLPH